MWQIVIKERITQVKNETIPTTSKRRVGIFFPIKCAQHLRTLSEVIPREIFRKGVNYENQTTPPSTDPCV